MKFKNSIIILMLVAIIMLSGCFGNFALTRKVYNVNENIQDKFIRSAVTWAFVILPVYNIATFIDFIGLNLIEFWTGDNPLVMNVGDIDSQIIVTDNGRYEMTATPNRFDIVSLEGDNVGDYMSLIYNPDTQEWTLENDGNSNIIAKFHGETVELIYPSGKTEFYKM